MSTRPSFAAIIGHSDSPEMLDRCIRHHLGIGVDHVFVSANVEGGGLPDFHNDPRVRVMQAQAFTGPSRSAICRTPCGRWSSG